MPKGKGPVQLHTEKLQREVAKDIDLQDQDQQADAGIRAREYILPLIELLKKEPKDLLEDLKQLYRSRVDNPDQADMLPGVLEGLGLTQEGLALELTEEMVSKLGDKFPMIPLTHIKKMENFLLAYRETGNKSASAAKADTSTMTIGLWGHYYPQFKLCIDLVQEQVIDDLEQEARRRAFQGILKPTGWYKGQPGAYIKEYSDNLLMFLIKAYRPQFKDSMGSQGSAGGVAVQVNVTDYSGKAVVTNDAIDGEVEVITSDVSKDKPSVKPGS